MLQEFVFEESQTYQDIIQEGLQRGIAEGLQTGITEGRQEGIAEGRAEGSAREARWLIATVTQARFPDLFASLKGQIEQISDLAFERDFAAGEYCAECGGDPAIAA